MAKKGLDIRTMQEVLKNIDSWSLCVGAGINLPLLPDWYSLAQNIISAHCASDNIDIELYKKHGFTADAMIQAVRNHISVDDDEFRKMISEELYAPIKNVLSTDDWKAFVKIHEGKGLDHIKKEEWTIFARIVDTYMKDLSANYLAQVVVSSIVNKVEPKTILSFNGEAIFLALLNYYYWNSAPRDNNKDKFDRIVNGICSTSNYRIPYVHCHGVLPINGVKQKKGMRADEKLVFLEDSYLRLANSPISWQAIQFIENCMNSRMVFVGVSLTDPNMRRWLGWIHNNKMQEFKTNGIKTDNSTEHYWINKKPGTTVEKIWIEESVAHLGVRLVWIDNWSQVGEALRKMLGIN